MPFCLSNLITLSKILVLTRLYEINKHSSSLTIILTHLYLIDFPICIS